MSTQRVSGYTTRSGKRVGAYTRGVGGGGVNSRPRRSGGFHRVGIANLAGAVQHNSINKELGTRPQRPLSAASPEFGMLGSAKASRTRASRGYNRSSGRLTGARTRVALAGSQGDSFWHY